MPKWLQAMRQTTTYLGVVVMAILWGGIYLLASEQHERAYQDAVRQGSNLTRVLEEYVNRVVQQSDEALLALRRAYQKDPEHFDIAMWVAQTRYANNLAVEYGIANGKGYVVKTSHGAETPPVYVGNRENFTAQRDARIDELYISAPVFGQLSK